MLEAITPRGFARSPDKKPVKRFVCLTSNSCVDPAAFFPDPTQAGAKYDLPETLAPLEPQKADITLFSHLDPGHTSGHQGCRCCSAG